MIQPIASALSPEALAFMAQPSSRATIAIDAPKRWFVTSLSPTIRKPERVQTFVAGLGIEAYWPKRVVARRSQVRRAGRKPQMVEHVLPLLPRYLLVRLPQQNTPFGLLTTREARFHGICGFVGTSGPCYVRDQDVADIVTRENAGEWNAAKRQGRKVLSALPDWASPGSTVRVKDGAFAAFEALIEAHIAEGRMRITVMMFGRSTPVEIDLSELEAA